MAKQIGKNVYMVSYGAKKAAAVTFGKDAAHAIDAAFGDKKTMAGAKTNGRKYVPRGDNDAKLLELHKVASESPNKWQFLKTNRNFLAGMGVGPHVEKVVQDSLKYVPVPRSPQYRDWHEKLGLDDYVGSAAWQVTFQSELYVKLTLNLNKNTEALEVVDSFIIRPKKCQDGETRITHYYISSKFGQQKFVKESDCIEIPAFDPKNPTKYPVSIIHVRDQIPGQVYSAFGMWWGTEKVTKIANKVPDYYEATLDNGFFVTHHIEVPDDYFDKEGLSEEETETLKQTVLDGIAETLIGADKANKTLFTFSKLNIDGKTLNGIKINPLKNNVEDEAFLKLMDSINGMQSAGHGVRPDLAGVTIGNQLGTSGKELATSANYMQDYMTHLDREILLKPIRIAQKIDGIEPDKYLCVYRISSYTFDVTPKASGDNPNADTAQPETSQLSK